MTRKWTLWPGEIIMKSKNKIIYNILSALSLLILIIIAGNYIITGKFRFDEAAINYTLSIRSSRLDTFFKTITFLGNSITVTLITVITSILFIIYKKIKQALFLSISVCSIWIINELMKLIFKRPRPASYMRMIDVSGYSFPSGHAMIFTGLIIILVYFTAGFVKNKAQSLIIRTGLILAAVLVGISRVYLRVHYLSDVLAGFSAGIFLACLAILIFDYKIISK